MTGRGYRDGPVYLGIDIGGSSVKWTVTRGVVEPADDLEDPNDSEHIPAITVVDTPPSPQQLIEAIAGIAAEAKRRYGELSGVCVGTPGPVDETGTIRGAAVNLQGWGDRPVRELIAEVVETRTTVKNDTNLALLAESRVGAAAGAENVVGLFLGTGIGGGLFLDGTLYEGHHGLAGEIGHTVVDAAGPRCSCGQRGCLERYASARGLHERLVEHASAYPESSLAAELAFADPEGSAGRREPETELIPRFFETVRNGDPLAMAVYSVAADALAHAVGVAVNTLAPERVVIGGGIAEGAPSLLDAVSARLAAYTLPACRDQTSLVSAGLGRGAGAIGAALYARDVARDKH
jgi:glucokinase